jgi:hypothetical protein
MLNIDITLWINIAAILVMLYCFWLVLALKKQVPGGVIGRTWNFLVLLVTLFTIGYLASPFYGVLPIETMRLIAALIFFFGAIYVVITVKLIHRVIKILSE